MQSKQLATPEEIQELLTKKARKTKKPEEVVLPKQIDINDLSPTGAPLNFPSPLHLLAVIAPELTPYIWQTETLLLCGGFLDPLSTECHLPSAEKPLLLCVSAANGSGKDMVIIAAFCVWFALKGLNNLVVVTSSSYQQLKYQTEVHIRELIRRVNQQFGPTFHSVEFYHICLRTTSEIKLFVTDEAGKAEGYHPRMGGELAIVINEAKSVPEPIFEALERCTGYSYWFEISSPAGKSGHFYQSYLSAVPYPEPPELGKFYFRKVTAFECPHIPKSHIERAKERMTDWWFRSSILAEFCDLEEDVVISEELWDRASRNLVSSSDNSIGIGLDLAAGGDENSCWVRVGPKIVDAFHFTQSDTTITPEVIDRKLAHWKSQDYTFYADDGGVGKAIIDRLVQKGWHVSRLHNQSAARNKKEFLNIGAEMYFHVRRLMENGLIQPYIKDIKLKEQLTSRRYDQREGGKFRLEPKKEARIRTKFSPDRADAYVLCYYSYRPGNEESKVQLPRMSLEEFAYKLSWGRLRLTGASNYGRPTNLLGL